MPVEAPPTTGVARVLFLYNAAFPPLAFATLAYVGLADAVFAVNRVIGKRLHPRLRRLLRSTYVGLNSIIAAVLHVALWSYCGTDDACAEQPLHRRTCLLTASLSLAVVLTTRFMDRILVPMIFNNGPKNAVMPLESYETWLRARVVHGITMCVLWMCMAEAEVLGLVVLLAVTARRALAPVAPGLARGYIGLFKLYTLVHTSWVLNDDCAEATTKRMPVAVLATLLVI